MTLDRINRGYSHRMRSFSATFDHADAALNVAATSAAIALKKLPAGAVYHGHQVKVTQAFDDGGAGTFDLDIGDGTTANLYADNVDLDSVANLDGAQHKDAGGITITLTFVGDVNLSTLTTGTCTVTIYYSVPDPAA